MDKIKKPALLEQPAGYDKSSISNSTAPVNAISQAAKISEALQGRQSNGSHWIMHCPAHDDTNPSLSVTVENGKILLKCHTGCPQAAVIDALQKRGLWNGKSENSGIRKETEYDYMDETGKLLYQAVRRYRDGKKSFYQRRSDPSGGWINNLKGVEPVIYNLPAVIRAVKNKQPIFITEGEKDVDCLERFGYTATRNSGGAEKWYAEHAAYLKGAVAYLVGDYDVPGQKHIEKVFNSLQGIAKSVKVIDLGFPVKDNHGKDVSDWLDVHSKKEFEKLIANAGENKEKEEHPERKKAFMLDELLKVDFPELIFYVDRLITSGLTLLWGPPKGGKSIFVLHILLAISNGGYALGSLKCQQADVLLISLEDGPRRLQARLKAAGAMPNKFFYIFTEWERAEKGLEHL